MSMPSRAIFCPGRAVGKALPGTGRHPPLILIRPILSGMKGTGLEVNQCHCSHKITMGQIDEMKEIGYNVVIKLTDRGVASAELEHQLRSVCCLGVARLRRR